MADETRRDETSHGGNVSPPQLIVNYDPATNNIAWGMTGPMPLPLLVFTLEKIKLQLLADDVKKQMELAEQSKMQNSIIVPQGGKLPMNFKR